MAFSYFQHQNFKTVVDSLVYRRIRLHLFLGLDKSNMIIDVIGLLDVRQIICVAGCRNSSC